MLYKCVYVRSVLTVNDRGQVAIYIEYMFLVLLLGIPSDVAFYLRMTIVTIMAIVCHVNSSFYVSETLVVSVGA